MDNTCNLGASSSRRSAPSGPSPVLGGINVDVVAVPVVAITRIDAPATREHHPTIVRSTVLVDDQSLWCFENGFLPDAPMRSISILRPPLRRRGSLGPRSSCHLGARSPDLVWASVHGALQIPSRWFLRSASDAARATRTCSRPDTSGTPTSHHDPPSVHSYGSVSMTMT